MERTGNITFSVIVPVYNVQAYLSACVKSVVEQAGPADWECILVDDGSTDACPAMCDAFAQLCPGVTVIHRSNGGLAAARNTGIKAAKGKWLLFLDSDDYWPPHMLDRLITLGVLSHLRQFHLQHLMNFRSVCSIFHDTG